MGMKERVPDPWRRWAKVGRARLFETFGSMRYSRPGLFGLDSLLAPYLPSVPGVFLEIGANDGYSQSNTYHLERVLGWRGILIEPLPHLAKMCRQVRPGSWCFEVACTSDGHGEVEVMDMGLMSVVLGQQAPAEEQGRLLDSRPVLTVPTTTLSAVIDATSETHIDFMSIDVEGAELSVLGGLDLERHTPDAMLVETQHPDAVDAVLPTMRRVAKLTHHDYIYVA